MNLINDLGDEVAFAVLVEKRHLEKIDSGDVLPLISRIKEVLQAVSAEEEIREENPTPERSIKAASH